MSELENIKSLEKYDAWKKAKRSRKSWIGWIATLIGGAIALIVTYAILKVGVSDVWKLGKGVFASEEKILEHVPKIEEIDNKLKKSIVASPTKWISKKYEEQVAAEVLKGNLGAIATGIRIYAGILIFIWFIVLWITWMIVYLLGYWIISSFMWHEPTLSGQYLKKR